MGGRQANQDGKQADGGERPKPQTQPQKTGGKPEPKPARKPRG